MKCWLVVFFVQNKTFQITVIQYRPGKLVLANSGQAIVYPISVYEPFYIVH